MINLNDYFGQYQKILETKDYVMNLEKLLSKLRDQKEKKGRLLVFGNGASASIASHAALDFTKQGKLETLCFHDPALITAYANDYGYENAFKEIINSYSRPTDILIFISVSGESQNLINAARRAKEIGLITVGFTGRFFDNTLNKLVDHSFWVDSHAYNIVENMHSIWITSLIDCLVGKAVYEVK